MREYSRVSELLQDASQKHAFHLQVQWARSGWCGLVSEVLATLDSADAMTHLQLATPGDGLEAETDQEADCDLFFRLVVRCAAHRAWVSASWSETAPNNWSGMLDDDAGEAQAALNKMYLDARCVERGLEVLQQEDHPEREAR